MSQILDFLRRLAANNERPWFQAHKDEYEHARTLWYGYLDRMFAAMSAWEPSAARADAKACSYRIYRDTRFREDKTPYKTHFSAEFNPVGAPRAHYAGWYVQLSALPGESGVYAGLWQPDAAQLRRIRRDIVDNYDEFLSIVNDPAMVEVYGAEWWGRKLKTAPKGWPTDHECIEYLRLLHYGREHSVSDDFFDLPDWPERLAGLMRPAKPLVDFLNYSLTEQD